MLAGEGRAGGDEVGGRALEDDPTASGAGHIPYVKHPDGYVAIVFAIISRGAMF